MNLKHDYMTQSSPPRTAPSAGGLPLIGQSFKAASDPLALLKVLSTQYKDVVKVRLGFQDYYLLQSPAAAKHVLQENAQNYYKPGAAKLMKRVLGNGIATSNGEVWLKGRRLIQPAFHKQRLAHFYKLLQREIDTLIFRWKSNPCLSARNASEDFLHLTMNNLTKAMFGTGIEKEMQELSDVLGIMLRFSSRYTKSLIKIPLSIPTKNNRMFLTAEDQFEKLICRLITKREREPDSSADYVDLLDMLMSTHDIKPGSAMSVKQIRDEIITIFMAGHETTAQTLGWVFYQLAMQPELYKKVREEAIATKEKLSVADLLQRLPYTKALVEETMRFYPPVWIMARKAATADCINGFHIPKAATVLINVYGMHHHPCYWENPELYNPDRFYLMTKEAFASCVYVPFGAGPRMCIGQHFAMMVMLSVVMRLVQDFSFSIPDGFLPQLDANLTLRAKEGIHLKIVQNPVYV